MRLISRLAVFCVLVVLPRFSSAQSAYGVSIDTRGVRGLSGKLVFDMTSNLPLTNRFDIINFLTDGKTDTLETQGELVTGDLVLNSQLAKFSRVNADTFFTELALPFAVFGDLIRFTLNVSETGPLDARPPDEFSLFLLVEQDGRPMTAGNPDGDPDMSITITGKRGGQLDALTQERVIRRAGGRVVDRINPPGENDLGRSAVTFTVTPAWTPDSPTLSENAQRFTGMLTEFCNRRCAADVAICTGGAFGISVDANTFYAFDDVGNLKAQVALVDGGQNPQREGQFSRATVVGVLNNSNSVLTVLNISVF